MKEKITKYRITQEGKKGYFMAGFFPNSGWKIRNVFVFNRKCWFIFTSEAEVQEYLMELKNECEKQRGRWKEWTETALNVVKKLKCESYEEEI